MGRTLLLLFVFLLGSVPSIAISAKFSPATYILQISSNLSCETLDIELISQADDTRQHIRYGSSAFAAVELPSGSYTFGDVTCMNKEDTKAHDLLSDKIAPIHLNAGQAYYGGRIIFEEVVAVDANGSPDVFSNCPRVMSRARGQSSNQCRDGVGVDTSAPTSKHINVYRPEVTDEDLAVVRSALSATKEQLLYLPLKLQVNKVPTESEPAGRVL
jgi:hypothetical protein